MIDMIARLEAKRPTVEPGDYTEGGILICGKCKTPKQCRIEIGGNKLIVTCMCKCREEQLKREDEEWKEQEEMKEIATARTAGIQDKRLLNCTFAMDDGKDPKMIKLARRYVEHWDEMLESNQGLILCGDVGSGKTFLAGCIANALIDKGVPVLATDFTRVLSAVQRDFGGQGYINTLDCYKLLVIDDLGAERQSDFAMEQVFAVVNGRYKAKLPVIFTTNLSVDELKNPNEVRYSRIYDRILEMCIPVYVKGESRRKEIADRKKDKARKILFGSD